MIQEHDLAALTEDLPEHGLKAGDVGTVVHVHGQGVAYEVEFFSPAGNTTAVVTVESHQTRPASPDEVEPLTVDYNWAKDGIAVLTLVNPKKRNVLSSRTLCTRVMEGIRLLPKPVIAQVQGLATAAGCQLVATCDIAVAADTAAFATPGVQIGLFCTTPGVAVARSVMPKKAMEMLLTGRPISAQEALEFGLISRIAPADELEAQVMDLARQIASASAQTLALGKAAFYQQIEMDRPSAYQFAGKVMVDNLLEDDAHEGITAFLEKRAPVWTT